MQASQQTGQPNDSAADVHLFGGTGLLASPAGSWNGKRAAVAVMATSTGGALGAGSDREACTSPSSELVVSR